MWDELWKIVVAVLASVGGIGVLITAAVAFSSNLIAERLSKKYELQLSKELEKHKTVLDNKNYMSKTRFDKEFCIYQELSDKRLELVFATSGLTKLIGTSEEEIEMISNDLKKSGSKEEYSFKQLFDKAIVNYNISNSSNRKYAPFIEEDMYLEVDKLNRLCYRQAVDCKTYYNTEDSFADVTIIGSVPAEITKPVEKFFSNKDKKETLLDEITARQKEISLKSDQLTKNMRDYLKSLEVKENG